MKNHQTIHKIATCAIFLAVLVVSAYIAIPVGEISFTLQVLAVCLIAFILPMEDAFLVMLAYLVMGLIGIPVFTGFTGGIATLTKASFGYIIGFIFVPFVCAPFKKLPIRVHFVQFLIGGIVSLLVIYIFGTAYFYFLMRYVNGIEYGLGKICTICIVPFIPFDLLKIIVAAIAAMALEKVVKFDVNKKIKKESKDSNE